MSIVPVFGIQTVTILCTIDYLTKSFSDEIMGIKEELHEDGHSEADTSRIDEETRTRLENEEVSPDFEGIKKRISEEWATGTSTELKVVDTAS